MSEGAVDHVGCGGHFNFVMILCPEFNGFICGTCNHRWDGRTPGVAEFCKDEDGPHPTPVRGGAR